MKQKHAGICNLCGKEFDNLTFEHIPPRAAYNSTPAKPVTGIELFDDDKLLWDISGLPYINQQKGMGRYSLCQSCNNNTGGWYAEEYITIAKIIHNTLSCPINMENRALVIEDTYPLRFIKQVLSMFCSINRVEDKRLDPIRQFVLNKECSGLDKSKFKICMYLTNSNLNKQISMSCIIKNFSVKPFTILLSEITAYPFGFILFFDPPDLFDFPGLDITHFADCKYDDKATMEIPLLIYEVNDHYPMSYRSKDEILKCRKENENLIK